MNLGGVNMENYVGKRLDGRYEVQEIIGVGGMAVVYKAYDSIDDRIVAVKILKDEFLANEEFRRRFKNESKAIAVLSHPNIVKVFDVSYGDRLQYIVMEHVEGITLKEYIVQRGKINWKEAVHFVTQILRALQHAHDKGIVHRDVKPQNIMLLQNGNIKVTDFGIARFSRSETRTMTESAIGSVHYISPEQARGDLTDDKADIYSVGVVMYEMLTGQLPFQSDNSVSVAIMQVQADPKRPREINDTIPPGLEQITMRAMQKNPKERYQSAAEMLLDLEEFRRNPSIKFEYNCFVDREPTKFVNKPITNTPAVKHNSPEDYENDDESEGERKKIVPVLTGIAFGLIALVLIVVGIIFVNYKLIGNGDKLVVPDLAGKNYNDIKDDDEYGKFEFDITPVQNSDHPDGYILQQDPVKGKKINTGEKIKLTVVKGETLLSLPDVSGMDYGNAKRTLENLGFKVIPVPEANTKYDNFQAIRTNPVEGTQVQTGTEVLLYYASEENLIPVPLLMGMTVDNAKGALESMNLVLDENVKYEHSTQKKGIIISQDYKENDMVPMGTKIKVTLSDGVPPESNATIIIQLPSLNEFRNVKVTINKEVVREKSVYLDGADYSFDVTGSGKSNSLQVFADSDLIYECKVDFTTNPAKVYDATSISIITENRIPRLIGMTESEATKALKDSGFENFDIQTEEVDIYRSDLVGKVLSQDPNNYFKLYDTDIMVTLVIGIRDETDTSATNESTSEESF